MKYALLDRGATPRQLVATLARSLHDDAPARFADYTHRLRTPAFSIRDSAGERRPPAPVTPADLPQCILDACFNDRVATNTVPAHEDDTIAIWTITARNASRGVTITLNFRRIRDNPENDHAPDNRAARWRLDFLDAT